MREKIKQDVKTGQLPSGTDAMALAAHTMAVIRGLNKTVGANESPPWDRMPHLDFGRGGAEVQ